MFEKVADQQNDTDKDEPYAADGEQSAQFGQLPGKDTLNVALSRQRGAPERQSAED